MTSIGLKNIFWYRWYFALSPQAKKSSKKNAYIGFTADFARVRCEKECRGAEKVQPERKSITGEKLLLVSITSFGYSQQCTVQGGKYSIKSLASPVHIDVIGVCSSNKDGRVVFSKFSVKNKAQIR